MRVRSSRNTLLRVERCGDNTVMEIMSRCMACMMCGVCNKEEVWDSWDERLGKNKSCFKTSAVTVDEGQAGSVFLGCGETR